MKKTVLVLFVLILVMPMFIACAPDATPDVEPEKTYELMSDTKLTMSTFLGNIPEDYAALKEPLEATFAIRESALEQRLGIDIQIGFRKVAYTYPSTDAKGDPITLSSVAFWLGYFVNDVWNDLQPDNICLMEHYTITSDAEAPTNTFPLEMFITGNTLTIMPDYIGYGVTKDLSHPYLHHDVCAINSIDALTSGYDLFGETGRCGVAEGWKLYLAGASQGAANAIAVHKYLDTHMELAEKWNFASSNCSSGPYSPVATIDKYLTDGKVSYPVVFPLVIKTMFDSYPQIMSGFTEEMAYAQNYLAARDEIEDMIAGKEHNTSAINQVFIDKVRKTVDADLAEDEIYLTDILSPEMLDKDSNICKAFYRCLEKNDLTKGWTPIHPMNLHYSPYDAVVPQENSLAILDAFGADIVTLQEQSIPVEHATTCSIWMLTLFSKGF